MSLDPYRAANLANWDERVEGHLAPDGYDIEPLVNDPDHLTRVVAFDRDVFGAITGKTLLHSQCHIGTDTLAWAKLGARVTGLDFSSEAIRAGRRIADRMGADATFVETELYDAPNHIMEEFDLVYTSVGAICWLPDIGGWAKVLAGFLKPGGQFYIRDTHPVLSTIDDERDDGELVMKYPYFHRDSPICWPDASSYAGSAVLTNTDSYEWFHPLSDVVMALIDAGLVIERLAEHRHLDWPALPIMEPSAPGVDEWVLPPALRDRIPLQFSILAHKPDLEDAQ